MRWSARSLAVIVTAGAVGVTGGAWGRAASGNARLGRTTTLTGAATPAALEWQPCDGSAECATLPVPLDYRHPTRKTIEVALLRYRATDPSRRIGSLLANPGGPGASGVEFVRATYPAFPAELRARFDIVGFDPRGTGGTIPVDCRGDLEEFLALDRSPETRNERGQIDKVLKQFARGCERSNREVLRFVSTESTARDMDRIRSAVGDRQLTYVGFSYGTYLGTFYANLFPPKVRAMVLDGPVDPDLSGLQTVRDQAVGFEQSLDAFFTQCSQDTACPFFNDGDPASAFDRLAAEVDTRPLTSASGRSLGPSELDFGVSQALYDGERGYMGLAEALASAQQADPTQLLALSDEYTGRMEDGSYDPVHEAYLAISCVDGQPDIGGLKSFRAAEGKLRAAAPRLGVATLNEYVVCAHWPVPPVERRQSWDAEGSRPILVIGTTKDPATPFQWAEALSDDLSSAVLLTVDGTRHTAFLLNQCVDDNTVSYLVDLQAPPDGTRCG